MIQLPPAALAFTLLFTMMVGAMIGRASVRDTDPVPSAIGDHYVPDALRCAEDEVISYQTDALGCVHIDAIRGHEPYQHRTPTPNATPVESTLDASDSACGSDSECANPTPTDYFASPPCVYGELQNPDTGECYPAPLDALR